MQDYEKLGSFYLGKAYDLDARRRRDDLLLYDSKDLVTHAVIVGMTGSGKTGLGIDLLEEAAIDGIPSIVIDPKGDLTNLALTFPGLSAQEFRPWINEEDGARKGLSPDQMAAQQAEMWAKGLAEWGQDGARVQRLRSAAEVTIYTPGSSAGRSVSILRSLGSPPPEVADDPELIRERVATTAGSLLGLLGIDADPVRSREHILLSTLIARAWGERKDLDLGTLIGQIQQPPVTRIGVMDVESFFPGKDRFELAMALNGLLASPGFGAWMEGEALDIGSMLYSREGKPRIAVFSIAHLSDAERMFFVSLLLGQVLTWTRSQSGTSSLRALVYMDEIAGYFPPVANPPSKQPLLTLMKQARAFGVGVVLATQNPVDIDYKGLSNAGTWFIGRLQTERDKARVLDGLEGAAAAASARFDRTSVEQTLSQLGSRVFLMNNVHEDAPEIFETRWALSYLRGPLTRAQVRALSRTGGAPAPAAATSSPTPAAVAAPVAAAATPKPGPSAQPRPVLAAEVPQCFVPVRSSRPAGAAVLYQPALLGSAKVFFSDAKLGVESDLPLLYTTPLNDGPVVADWESASPAEVADTDLLKQPEETGAPVAFGHLPGPAGVAKSYDAWKKAYTDYVFRTGKLELLKSAALGEISRVGESEKDFRVRLAQAAREQRDAFAAKLRQKYASKASTLQERIRKAQQAVEVQKAQARDAKWATAMSFGSAVLGAFLGRKMASATNVGKAATAMKGVGRSMREGGDVDRAEESVEALQAQAAALEAQIQAEINEAGARVDVSGEVFERVSLRPKRTNITVRLVSLAWMPYWQSPSGDMTPAWE